MKYQRQAPMPMPSYSRGAAMPLAIPSVGNMIRIHFVHQTNGMREPRKWSVDGEVTDVFDYQEYAIVRYFDLTDTKKVRCCLRIEKVRPMTRKYEVLS